ncbi:serine protease 33-like [Brachionus plicatilis]|uniref:Serine protease 33-like n=1 Tax=Brachionus plicatilis TaxID=10195 RepID=A0A3M7RR71_BRAPC|nr:serine protease 33-like [Brachionus plicatilis]
MTRKSSYKIAEHEKSLNRVDVFRSIQTPNRVLTEAQLTNNPDYTGGNYAFENPSFITSNLNINKNKKRPGVWTIPDPDVNSIDSRERKKYLKQSEPKSIKKSKRPIIIASIICLVILILVLIAVAIFLGIFLSTQKTSRCLPECTDNRYCLESKSNNTNPLCTCKPGFVDDDQNKCSKSICFSDYVPFSYVNTIPDSSSKPVEYSSKFTRPYCCQVENQLTDSCCGVARKSKELMRSVRIIGGETIEEGIFPWIVFVAQVYRENPNSPLKLIKNCSGSLINKNYVVTAAHCMHFESSYNTEFPNIERVVRVFFGFVDKTNIELYDEINQRRVSKVIVHPNFVLNTLQNDIALLKLDKPVPRDYLVDYLCLFHYDQTDNLLGSNKLYTAGWGNTEKYGSNYPDKLNYVDVRIFPIDDCKYMYPPDYDYLFNENINVCAGYEAQVGKDSCNQDSGGPLMAELNGQWFLYGKN